MAWPTRSIVHWPAGIAARGEVRHQYVHAIDLLPTILDVIGIEPPAEVGGVAQQAARRREHPRRPSTTPGAPEVRTVQHYEMLGCRALYQDGWKAVTYQEIQVDEPRLDEAVWELYDLRADPSECHDLAGRRARAARRP